MTHDRAGQTRLSSQGAVFIAYLPWRPDVSLRQETRGDRRTSRDSWRGGEVRPGQDSRGGGGSHKGSGAPGLWAPLPPPLGPLGLSFVDVNYS